MKKLLYALLIMSGFGMITFSCQKTALDVQEQAVISDQVIDQLIHLGFNPDGIVRVDEGYRIERDIIITDEYLSSNPHFVQVPNTEQFHTNALVNAGSGRVITVYIDAPPSGAGNSTTSGPGNAKGGNGNGGKPSGGGGTQFDQLYADALADALGRYNALNLEISFDRTDNKNAADIEFTRLRKGDERQGILGSAGFPSNGDPYGEVKMSGIINSTYGWSQEAIATVMAHELGHCIGFRHTDYYDRSISCGGSPYNEGPAGIGAVHIPGTPDVGQVNYNGQSWMLSCSGGQDRPFNNNDRTALDYLY